MDTDDQIDITFDFRSDTPPHADPDARSPALRRYHKRLWSKPLPNGVMFHLATTTPGIHLHHKSAIGEFKLSSDCVVPTFHRATRIANIINQLPLKDRESFLRLSYTIGGMMIFPGNRVNGCMTINGARGCHPRIKDRFDLTVECIRLYYCDEPSPLSEALARYDDFFHLFGSFRGYIDFFLLQDLVTNDYSGVRFFARFDGFEPWPLLYSLPSYLSYRQLAEEFIQARNQRIQAALAVPAPAGE